MTVGQEPSGHEARWSAAAQLARGDNDGGLGHRRARVLITVFLTLLGVVLLGALLVAVIPPNDASSVDDGSSWDARAIAALVILAMGVAGGVGGFIWARATGHYVTRWRSILSPLTGAERKSVMRQLAAKEELDEPHRDVIVAGARQLQRSVIGVAPIYGMLLAISASTLLQTRSTIVLVLELLAITAFAVAAIIMVAQYRGIGRFLELHDAGAIRPPALASPRGTPLANLYSLDDRGSSSDDLNRARPRNQRARAASGLMPSTRPHSCAPVQAGRRVHHSRSFPPLAWYMSGRD